MEQLQFYRTWTQSDPAYNQTEAWPASLFPDAEFHYFRECGCLVTSLAIMLRLFQIETETDPAKFNPWILNQRLVAAGAFGADAGLIIRRLDRLYPLEYLGQFPYTTEALAEAFHSGAPFLITVPGVNAPRHFIVPDHLTDSDVAVIDCAWKKKLLSEYETVCELRRFRRLEGWKKPQSCSADK